MWRSLFLAIGITLCIVGGECLLIDKVVMAKKPDINATDSTTEATTDVVPPEWAPWSLLSAGAVVMIYSFTIPKRVKG